MSIFSGAELEEMSAAMVDTGISQESAAETAYILHRCRTSDEAIGTLTGAIAALTLNQIHRDDVDKDGWVKHRVAVRILCALYLKADGIAKN